MDYVLDVLGSIPGVADLSHLHCVETDSGAHPHTLPPIQWVRGSVSSGIKRPGCEADHPPQSIVEVKNGGALLRLPHTSSWHGS
jgi:hypothetical protein